MRIGYARVSTRAQLESLEAQKLALQGAGCERVYDDVASGAKSARPGLDAAVDYAREGDAIVVTRLDRLGRTMLDTLRTVLELDARGIRIHAQDVDLDTSTAMGKFFIHINLALAQMERDQLIERTQACLAYARAQGKHGGRKPKLSPEQRSAAMAAINAGMSMTQVGKLYGVSRWTVQRLKESEQGGQG